ncbi:putative Zinc finger, RING/FYVE/PHD-type [Lupinus albus]|uniref:Putative Zinc finger, RING/FYVE/PHD-type n=1 Tax=Lupinus albus TaxID=3870 RepID=A0A6A4Q580_LUPAL|nr:putative Zinc finger, RING/FYVE/PHD-type [Lupinus albus]
MAKDGKEGCKSQSRGHRATPYLLSCAQKNLKDVNVKKSFPKASEKKDWEDAMCSVCMEVPHNAILLLCSSYNKGCRPYMCATSHRYSNCFEQYKKAYTKPSSVQSLHLDTGNSNFDLSTGEHNENTEVTEILCPLCRRQVKGWTVVEVARKSLNAKKRSCVKDDCSFVGNYKQLRKHVRSKHPFSRPREVDPIREEKWKRFECERERNDVISTILSSTPGAMVLGDYVLEPNSQSFFSGEYDSDDLENDFFSMSSFGLGRNSRFLSDIRYSQDHASSAVAGSRLHRLLLGRSRRRRRHRTQNASR